MLKQKRGGEVSGSPTLLQRVSSLARKRGHFRPTHSRATLVHLISGTGKPDAKQGKTTIDPAVISFISGWAAIWGTAAGKRKHRLMGSGGEGRMALAGRAAGEVAGTYTGRAG